MGQFTAAGWEHLLNSPAADALEQLTIGYRGPWQTAEENRVGPDLARVLAESPAHSRLKFLWLCECGLGDEGFTRLAKEARFASLETLHIDYDGLGAGGLKALGSAKFRALTHLQISSCELRDDALKALVASPLMGRLEHLDLSLNELTAAGARAIASSRLSRKLKHLDLGCNNIGDAGAEALAASKNFPALEEMHLSSARLGDKGATAVGKAAWVGQLTTLFMSYNTISARKQAQMKKQFGPKLWIDGST
jgi:Ran GTPase-activating protein (RanGAP) involved in mRNA processing and transport